MDALIFSCPHAAHNALILHVVSAISTSCHVIERFAQLSLVKILSKFYAPHADIFRSMLLLFLMITNVFVFLCIKIVVSKDLLWSFALAEDEILIVS